MKTRILQTKFWEDDYILSLSTKEKCLYNYYLTNSAIGMTGIYEIAPYLVKVFTAMTEGEINTANEKFMNDGKILFYKNWVKIVNATKYQEFSGPTNEKAIEKELSLIPDEVSTFFDTPSIPYQGGMDRVSDTPDTPNNHKSVISNHKSVKGEIVKRGGIDEEYMQALAEEFNVPLAFVRSKHDDLNNWTQEKPARARGRNLRITLRAWVKKDAMERRENVKSKIAYVGDTL